MEASDSGHTDVVQLLISSGAQVDLQETEVRHNINYSRAFVKGYYWVKDTYDILLGLPDM